MTLFIEVKIFDQSHLFAYKSQLYIHELSFWKFPLDVTQHTCVYLYLQYTSKYFLVAQTNFSKQALNWDLTKFRIQ